MAVTEYSHILGTNPINPITDEEIIKKRKQISYIILKAAAGLLYHLSRLSTTR